MNIPLLAAEISRLIPELACDSQVNNAEFLERLIRQHYRGETYCISPLSAEEIKVIEKAFRDNPPQLTPIKLCGTCW